jgi:hypothetical protein
MAGDPAMRTIDAPDRRANDLFKPLRAIKPESQKIGNPVMNPVIATARGAFSLPVSFRIGQSFLERC